MAGRAGSGGCKRVGRVSGEEGRVRHCLDKGGGESLVDAVFSVHADENVIVVICGNFQLDGIGRARLPLAPDLTVENKFSGAVFSAPVNLEIPACLAEESRTLLHIETTLPCYL